MYLSSSYSVIITLYYTIQILTLSHSLSQLQKIRLRAGLGSAWFHGLAAYRCRIALDTRFFDALVLYNYE